MRRIVGAAFVSLDGVMQAPGGPDEDTSGGFAYGGWLEPLGDEALEGGIGALFERDFSLLLGRRTYDIFSGYWPYIPHDNPISASFAKAEKYVLTSSDAPLDWTGSHRLTNLDALAEVKQGSGPDLVIQGSSTLYPQLMARDLLDRLVLMIAPVVLGSGKKLFGDDGGARTFQLVQQQIGSRGIICATYDCDGPVKTGTFDDGTVPPSEQELARREQIAKGTW